jgi:hypothetical protein
MVKNYTDNQLLTKVKSLPSFKSIPTGYWILGVQSSLDQFNTFDDKFYLFRGEQFVMVTTGTTNAGKNGMMNYESQNPQGVAVIKTNEWYPNVWKFGLHHGKIEALKQVRPFLISRDWDKDQQIEESTPKPVMCGINFHPNSYNLATTEIKSLIGPWSLGCQVVNDMPKYKKIIELVKGQKAVTYCLLKEF